MLRQLLLLALLLTSVTAPLSASAQPIRLTIVDELGQGQIREQIQIRVGDAEAVLRVARSNPRDAVVFELPAPGTYAVQLRASSVLLRSDGHATTVNTSGIAPVHVMASATFGVVLVATSPFAPPTVSLAPIQQDPIAPMPGLAGTAPPDGSGWLAACQAAHPDPFDLTCIRLLFPDAPFDDASVAAQPSSPSSRYECEKCQRQARDCHESHAGMHSAVTSVRMGYTCQAFDDTCARICR